MMLIIVPPSRSVRCILCAMLPPAEQKMQQTPVEKFPQSKPNRSLGAKNRSAKRVRKLKKKMTIRYKIKEEEA